MRSRILAVLAVLVAIASIAHLGAQQVLIGTKFIDVVDSRTIASNGSGTPASLTFTPRTSYGALTCNDPDGCAITMGETGIVSGQQVLIINISTNVCTFATSLGVMQLSGPATLSQWGSISFEYVTDRWVEKGRNTGVAAGTVTSVALTMPTGFTVAGSPVTTSGTLAVTAANATANTVIAGPTTGSPAAWAFRALVAADIPNLDAAKITTGTIAAARLPDPIRLGNGSSGTPAYSFASDTGTGLYRSGANTIGISGDAIVADTDGGVALGGSAGANRFGALHLTSHAFLNRIYMGGLASTGLSANMAGIRAGYEASGGTCCAGMAEIIVGNESAIGDLHVNRIAAGLDGDVTFDSNLNYWNFKAPYTGANPSGTIVAFRSQLNMNPSADVTHDLAGGDIGVVTTGTHNFSDTAYGLIGLYGYVYTETSGTVARNTGLYADGEYGGSGTASKNIGLGIESGGYGSSTITDNYSIYVKTPYKGTTLTNHHGIFLEDQTLSGTTLDYAFHYAAPSSKDIIFGADGSVIFGDLKTTGAATGKKVVCVDTSTGRLYASSTGTDCSN